jgi:hypothetical protein
VLRKRVSTCEVIQHLRINSKEDLISKILNFEENDDDRVFDPKIYCDWID